MTRIKLEKEIDSLRATVKSLNNRVGDEVVLSDESDESEDESFGIATGNRREINTRHMQIDGLFAAKYFYITNVGTYFS